jgi:hypothetical protein
MQIKLHPCPQGRPGGVKSVRPSGNVKHFWADGQTNVSTHPVFAALDIPLSAKAERGSSFFFVLNPLCEAERVVEQRDDRVLTMRYVFVCLTYEHHLQLPSNI